MTVASSKLLLATMREVNDEKLREKNNKKKLTTFRTMMVMKMIITMSANNCTEL